MALKLVSQSPFHLQKSFGTILNNITLKRGLNSKILYNCFKTILNNATLKLNCQPFNSLVFLNYSKQHSTKTKEKSTTTGEKFGAILNNIALKSL